MNKDTLLEEARKVALDVNLAEQHGGIDRSLAYDVRYLIECINKLDEPQKPVIPQFVADYIEYHKVTGLTLGDWLDFVNDDEFEGKTQEWIYSGSYEENLKREYLLIDAIRNGYEVEKEQKYQVIIRDGEYVRLYLCKNNGNVMIGTNDNYIEKCPEVTYLTEQEIKSIDKRFWAFAEEVEQ